MYADLEEARARRARRISRSPELEVEKDSRRSGRHSSDGYDSRERELAEQLRSRALASRRSNDRPSRGRRRSFTSSDDDSRRSRSVSRSQSRDSVRSRRSHHSRKSSYRLDVDEVDHRRKRRRDSEDDYEGSRTHHRDREAEEADEQARERRRRRNQRYDSHDREHAPAGSSTSSHRAARTRYDSSHDDRSRNRDRNDRSYDRGSQRRPSQYSDDRRDVRRRSPAPTARSRRSPSPVNDDYEERSVFCTQLSVRLGQRDLGEFFEDHLGEGAVKDVRIVMDRITRRSKGVGYVEFAAKELVPKAIELTGKVLFGVPIVVQITDAARNRVSQNGGDSTRPNNAAHLASGGTPIDAAMLANVPHPMQYHTAAPNVGGALRAPHAGQAMPNTDARLYVGSLHFSLTDENVKSVFESFGEIEYVDLHREPGTGKSKGFCFIQYKQPEGAQRALEQMNGFELAGRTIRVGNVNAKGSVGGSSVGAPSSFQNDGNYGGGHLPQLTSAFDDGGGAGLNPERRAALMEKLARSEPIETSKPAVQERPANIPESVSTSLLLMNMFDPKEETEPDWNKDLAEDVRDECQAKYGAVTQIHVEKESAGEIYVTFADNAASNRALTGLNGRYFGGKLISAHYIPDAFVKAKLG